jgi:hypothetical protein
LRIKKCIKGVGTFALQFGKRGDHITFSIWLIQLKDHSILASGSLNTFIPISLGLAHFHRFICIPISLGLTQLTVLIPISLGSFTSHILRFLDDKYYDFKPKKVKSNFETLTGKWEFQIWSDRDGLSLPLDWLYLYLYLGLLLGEAHPPAPEHQQQLVEQT